MAYPARMMPSDLILQVPQGDAALPPVSAPGYTRDSGVTSAAVRPVTPLESLIGWLATAGLLLLIVGGTILASIVWFVALFFAEDHADEAAGE